MTVESDIFDTLKGLVGNRVYPDVWPNIDTLPLITYQQIGGDVVNYLDPMLADHKNGYFQINVWASTRAAAAALMLSIETAMVAASSFTARPMSAPIARHEADINLYGMHQDFNVWSTR